MFDPTSTKLLFTPNLTNLSLQTAGTQQQTQAPAPGKQQSKLAQWTTRAHNFLMTTRKDFNNIWVEGDPQRKIAFHYENEFFYSLSREKEKKDRTPIGNAQLLLAIPDEPLQKLAENQLRSSSINGFEEVEEYLLAVGASKELKQRATNLMGEIRDLVERISSSKRKERQPLEERLAIKKLALRKLILEHRIEYLRDYCKKNSATVITSEKLDLASQALNEIHNNETEYEDLEKDLQKLLCIHFAEFLLPLKDKNILTEEQKKLLDDKWNQLTDPNSSQNLKNSILVGEIANKLKDLISKYCPAEYLQQHAALEATKKLAKEHIETPTEARTKVKQLLEEACSSDANKSTEATQRLKEEAEQQVTASYLQAHYLNLLCIEYASKMDDRYNKKSMVRKLYGKKPFMPAVEANLKALEEEFPELKRLGDEIRSEIILGVNSKTLVKSLSNALRAKNYFAYRAQLHEKRRGRYEFNPEVFEVKELTNGEAPITVTFYDIEAFLTESCDQITKFCDARTQSLFQGSYVHDQMESGVELPHNPSQLNEMNASYVLPGPDETTLSGAYKYGHVAFVPNTETHGGNYVLRNTQEDKEAPPQRTIGIDFMYTLSAMEYLFPELTTKEDRIKKLNELYGQASDAKAKRRIACAMALDGLSTESDKRPSEMINAINESVRILNEGSRLTQPELPADHALKLQVKFIALTEQLDSTTLLQKPEDKKLEWNKYALFQSWERFEDPKGVVETKILDNKKNQAQLASAVRNMPEGSLKQSNQLIVRSTINDTKRKELSEFIESMANQYSRRGKRAFNLLDFESMRRTLGGHDANYEQALEHLDKFTAKLREIPPAKSYGDVEKDLRAEIRRSAQANEVQDIADLERIEKEATKAVEEAHKQAQKAYDNTATLNKTYNEERKKPLLKDYERKRKAYELAENRYEKKLSADKVATKKSVDAARNDLGELRFDRTIPPTRKEKRLVKKMGKAINATADADEQKKAAKKAMDSAEKLLNAFESTVKNLKSAQTALISAEAKLEQCEVKQAQARATLAKAKAILAEKARLTSVSSEDVASSKKADTEAKQAFTEAVDLELLSANRAGANNLKKELGTLSEELSEIYSATCKANEQKQNYFRRKVIGEETPLQKTLKTILLTLKHSNNPIAREALVLAQQKAKANAESVKSSSTPEASAVANTDVSLKKNPASSGNAKSSSTPKASAVANTDVSLKEKDHLLLWKEQEELKKLESTLRSKNLIRTFKPVR